MALTVFYTWQPDGARRILELIHRAIPYPLLLAGADGDTLDLALSQAFIAGDWR